MSAFGGKADIELSTAHFFTAWRSRSAQNRGRRQAGNGLTNEMLPNCKVRKHFDCALCDLPRAKRLVHIEQDEGKGDRPHEYAHSKTKVAQKC
jgi:hypothetical protein